MLTAWGGYRCIPVCGLRSLDEVEPLAQALIEGGLPVIEVTLRTPDALAHLEAMAAIDGLIVGAGTVRTAAQLRAVENAGAAFAISPCLTPSLATAAHATRIPFIPGVVTPTEVQTAVDAGFRTVKFFPAEASGGLSTLRALAEVFTDVSFVPTGGITQSTAAAYLAHPQVLAVGGSWMIPAGARAEGDWATVAASIAATVRSVAP